MTESLTASLVGASHDATRPQAAILRAIYPRELRWRQRITGDLITLGRQPDDGSPALPHATVSRRHALVWWDVRGHHAVRDAGSRHGTLIGTTTIGTTARVLADGDVIRLGDVLVVYEVAATDDVPAVDAPVVDQNHLPGAAPAMASLRARVAQAATDPSPALVIGATGTGKEWVARELHRVSGRTGPLVAVNCANFVPQLVESQLFGHARGAFTGATTDHEGLFRQADGGTLFLDEIGELPLELQPKLLRVVQDGMVQPVGFSRAVAVDVRLCAATNRDLAMQVESGGFRRDLYARLSKWELRVPSLAARRGDLLDWIDRMWRLWHVERGRSISPLALTPAATTALLGHTWPDNLRGVDRLVHELAARGVAAVDGPDLPSWVSAGTARARTGDPALPAPATGAGEGAPRSARPPVPPRDEFVKAWTELNGSVRALARHFGRDRRQIYRWLESHGIRASTDDDRD